MNVAQPIRRYDAVVPSWPPENPIALDRRNLPVDVSENRWVLNEPTRKMVIHWGETTIPSASVENSFKRYFRWLLSGHSSTHVYNSFKFVKVLVNTTAFQAACREDVEVPYLAFSEARAALGPQNRW